MTVSWASFMMLLRIATIFSTVFIDSAICFTFGPNMSLIIRSVMTFKSNCRVGELRPAKVFIPNIPRAWSYLRRCLAAASVVALTFWGLVLLGPEEGINWERVATTFPSALSSVAVLAASGWSAATPSVNLSKPISPFSTNRRAFAMSSAISRSVTSLSGTPMLRANRRK